MLVDRPTAKLFSIDGKRTVTLVGMTTLTAWLRVDAPPAAGSIAVMARNGVRVCGIVNQRTEDGFQLDFDHPISGRELELACGPAPAGALALT